MYQTYFILEWHSTCFGRSLRPSSGVQDCTYCNRHLSTRYCCLLASGYEMELPIHTLKQTAVSVWHMPVAVCTVLNSWWRTERPSETCRVSFQNKINLIHWCICSSISYPLASRQLYLFDIWLLLYVQSWTPDDRQKDCLKHVECHSKIK